jgi:spermidine synthase
LIANERIRLISNDGRVFLLRNKEPYDLIMLDAFRGGYIPFHLLTKEFYAIVKARLRPNGAAVFNIHRGTKLYTSTVATLRAVFPTVDLYDQGGGNVIAVATAAAKSDDRALMQRAIAAQTRYNFRYSLVRLLNARIDEPPDREAPPLTDDFAPVELYDVIKEQNKRRW